MADDHEFIPRLWATRRVGYLLDEIRLHGENAELRDEVTELARKYGIVTPYTAYLIVEDETRRNVPLGLQSLPQLYSDRLARKEATANWNGFKQEMDGAKAVAGARYGYELKNATAPAVIAESASLEANRALGFEGSVASAGGVPVATATPASDSKVRLAQYSQAGRFVAGKNFYQNDRQWVDEAAQKHPDLETPAHPFQLEGILRLRRQGTARPILGWRSARTCSSFWRTRCTRFTTPTTKTLIPRPPMKTKIPLVLLLAAGTVSALVNFAGAKESVAAAPAKETKKPLVQIAILLDTSGSMEGLIEQAKSQLWKICNEFLKARQDGVAPEVQVALYEYGKSSLKAETGWIRQIQPLTQDLDKISEELFALRTNGGEEYCGWVIQNAVNELEWNPAADVYKAIFIAGNEPFTQGPVNYAESCKAAITRGIIVNTIHCGPEAEGINTKWKDGADLADGKYLVIDQNRAVVSIETPQDQEIARLGRELNQTYLRLRSRGSRRGFAPGQAGRQCRGPRAGLRRGGATLGGQGFRELPEFSLGSGGCRQGQEFRDFQIENRGVARRAANAERR